MNKFSMFTTKWLQRLAEIFIPPVNSVVQIAYDEVVGSIAPISATIPRDNTIPQITEGVEIISIDVTPRKVGNYFLIEARVPMSETTNIASFFIAAVFRNTEPDAVAVGASIWHEGDNAIISKKIPITDLNETTFSLRIGTNNNTTTSRANVTGNPAVGIYNLGETITSSLKITEIQQ